MSEQNNNTRREFIKKSAYAAPAILSLAAIPAFAQNGSGEVGPGTACPINLNDEECYDD
jgi:hypothetical protein